MSSSCPWRPSETKASLFAPSGPELAGPLGFDLMMHIFHKWSLWVPYEESAMIQATSMGIAVGEPRPYVEVRQRRTCSVCGKTQDVLVKEGPMWPTGNPRERREATQ